MKLRQQIRRFARSLDTLLTYTIDIYGVDFDSPSPSEYRRKPKESA